MRTPSAAHRLVVAGLLLALGAACTPGAEEPPAPAPEPPTDQPPAEEPEEPEPPVDEPGDPLAVRVEVYFTRSTDDRIWVEPIERWVEIAGDDEADHAAISQLFASGPDDPSLSSAVPGDVSVLGVERDGDVLVVDVDAAMAATSGGSAQEIAFAEQLAHTAAALDGITRVRLTIDGAPIDELWGHLDWSVPIEPDPFALSPVTIETPAYDESVRVGQVRAAGQATVFEANFMIRLFDADGALVTETNVMASMGAPERGTWEHVFDIDEPGRYVIEVEEDDPSGGEGRTPLVVRREVDVAA